MSSPAGPGGSPIPEGSRDGGSWQAGIETLRWGLVKNLLWEGCDMSHPLQGFVEPQGFGG